MHMLQTLLAVEDVQTNFDYVWLEHFSAGDFLRDFRKKFCGSGSKTSYDRYVGICDFTFYRSMLEIFCGIDDCYVHFYVWSRNAFGNRTAFFYPKWIHSSTGGYCGRYCTGSDRRSDTVWTYEAVL